MKESVSRLLGGLNLSLAIIALFISHTAVLAQSDQIISLGRVMPGEVREEVIAFINTSDTILEIASISVTPPLKAESIKSLILPGGEGSFRLILDLDRVAGEFEGQVRVQFKGNSQPPLVLDIVGHFVPLIEFQPYAAFFVGTHKGNSRTASIDILNHHNEPLYLEAPPSHSERYAINLEVIERGKHYRLSLTLDGNAPAGTQSDEIILRAKPPQEMLLKVQANTRIRERVYHYPDSVDMGALPWKVARDYESVRDLSQILMVYRHDTDDFEIEATIDVDYVKLISEPGPKGDRYQMTLTLIPEKIVPGKIDGFVRIETNDEEFSVLEVPVTGYILEER